MRIFVDVGSHEGQSIEEAVKDRWAFDEIHAIEPMPQQFAVLQSRFGDDERVRLYPFALWSHTGQMLMFGTNEALEASPFASKVDVDPNVVTTVDCLHASQFFEPLGDGLIVNMNCEGSEVQILAELIAWGVIRQIAALLVSFDICKVRGQESAERVIRRDLANVGFDRYTAEYPEGETHQEQLAAWLETVG